LGRLAVDADLPFVAVDTTRIEYSSTWHLPAPFSPKQRVNLAFFQIEIKVVIASTPAEAFGDTCGL